MEEGELLARGSRAAAAWFCVALLMLLKAI